MKQLAYVALLAFASLLGCHERSEPEGEPTPAEPQKTVAVPAPTLAPAPAATVSDRDLENVPTEEDFEEQAEKEITPDNLEKKLDELEKEILSE